MQDMAMDPGVGGATAILYVDDEEMARKYFTRAMADDYAVLTANGVEQALAILAAPGHGIGVLVTDYRMPGLGGGALLRYVNEHHPYLVCLLVTAFADKDVLMESINGAEVFRVLEKPLDLTQLRHALRQAGERARERQARRDSLLAMQEALAFLVHELNAPLGTISNFARALEHRMAGDDVSSVASMMQENARYCITVLDSFVNSVKLAHGAVSGRGLHAVHSALRLLESLLESYPMTVEQRSMIRVDVLQDFAVTALPNCVALVLSSVLGTALRALESEERPAIHFTVLVETTPQILVRYNAPVTRSAPPVQGWGLMFCQRVMQSFGGNMQVQPEPGLSTVVTLNFPAIIQHKEKEGT